MYLKYQPKERKLEVSEVSEPGFGITGSLTENEVQTTLVTDDTEDMIRFPL